jgi:dTDP-3-amino-2,3,6-trideoxy-4-keto-D-glucose/dTDP-3-amino-3,4,6-trideoxy-alpha-D-glucose/dTDP-2,6-dideoxy-D-kanosamine transaminase
MPTKMRVPYSYLDRQFANVDDYLDDVRTLVQSGDFTLGRPLTEFEERFAAMCKLPYAVGVGSGTDALILALKAAGVEHGDEVITSPNTFIATVGAIAMAGARPVFVDSTEGYTIDPALIEAAITPKTKAIMPVHYSGNVARMDEIAAIAEKHGLVIVEDACQSISAERDGKPVGWWGAAAGFSLHPLKNLNVWGDGGVVVTRSAEMRDKLRLLRNHGLINRDEVAIFGHNSRLDTLQAVIGNRLISQTPFITEARIANAARYDEAFADIPEIRVPRREPNVKHVYHLYMLRVERRDELLAHLNENGVEAKVHYPIPVHLQPAAAYLGYRAGDFPVAEEGGRVLLSVPAHQHLTRDEIDYVIEQVRAFYKG